MQSIVTELRNVAERLKARPPERETLFPGWDPSTFEPSPDNPRSGIRRAALAIAAENISMDDGTKISLRDLGHLVHYIADMLE